MKPVTARRLELACVLMLTIVFICFTWRGLTMFFSDDDLMNMYKAWMTPALKIWKAQLLPWMPLSRPLGTAIYRVFYRIFGFHPLPLYILCWLLLIGNIFAAWRFFRAVAPSVFVALLALSLSLVHGLFQDLYLSAGTVYDRLCFLFTAVALTVYAHARNTEDGLSKSRIALISFLCLMAMNSKESGAAVPAILFCYEFVYCLPKAWRERRIRHWLRSIAPLYILLGILLAAFVIGRVRHTEDLTANPAYQAHPGIGHWLTNVAQYLSIVLYRHVDFTGITAAITLLAGLVLAIALRNRAMLFGWLYFVIAITPVALISIRPGYVLYVPNLGLGLYFAALLGLAVRRFFPRHDLNFAQAAAVMILTAFMTWIHATHWPNPWLVYDSPAWRLTDKMHRDYPTLKSGARILFVDDYPSDNGYDAMFNLRLIYRDPSIEVFRLKGPVEQQPDRTRPLQFDHVFTTALDTYAELDHRNIEQSIKFNILQDYLPGRYFDSARLDHAGYLNSGVFDAGPHGAGCWTTQSAKLKFDLYPANSRLTLKFWIPDDVAAAERRNLSVTVGGELLGTLPLHAGENNADFPVPASAINPAGFTILQLNVDKPWRKDGQEYGLVLLRAGFDYLALNK